MGGIVEDCFGVAKAHADLRMYSFGQIAWFGLDISFLFSLLKETTTRLLNETNGLKLQRMRPCWSRL